LITNALGFQFTYLVPLLFASIGIALTFIFWNLDIPSRAAGAKETGWITRESFILAVCWGLFTISTSVFLFLGANMGQDHGFSDIVAGLGNLSFAIPAMIVGFIIGSLMDRRVSRFSLMTVAPVLLGVFIFITSLGKAWWIVGVCLMGFAASLIPPVIFTTPPRIEKPGRIAQAIGFINMVGTFSMLISSPIAGILKDATGTWLAPFGFAGLMGISIAFVSFSIKRGLS
jgi:predicted MFS family arabinose efflux permease